MSESKTLSRRSFLATAGKLAAGATVGAAALSSVAASRASAPEAEAPTWPWPYPKADPEAVYWAANAAYYKYGCSQASFEAIINQLGSPFTQVPTAMMKFGEGGVVGWGSHCGALLGSSAAINLVFGNEPEVVSKLVGELTGWYTQELGSGSPLCHVSVTEWCKKNGVQVESQDRKDRCARVSGETAKKAVLLMNAQADGTFKAAFAPSQAVTGCQSCHGVAARAEVRAGVKQECVSCHGEMHRQ